jgi:hypothetical protein
MAEDAKDITIKIIRTDLETLKTETAFVFKPSDFKKITIEKHAISTDLTKRFEIKGTLVDDLSDDWANFLNQNPKDSIRVMVGDDIVVIMYVIAGPIDYVPLGFYMMKDQAFDAAGKITSKPKYIDLTQKEIKEGNIKAERESQALKNGEKKESYVGINAPNVNTTVDAP